MNVEQVLLVLYHLVILLANDKKWPPKQFQALKEKLTSLETQMNGANGWGPPKDRSPSGCPGSLTLKNLQEFTGDPHVIEECILDGKLSVLGGFYSVPLGRSCQGGIATIGKAFDNL